MHARVTLSGVSLLLLVAALLLGALGFGGLATEWNAARTPAWTCAALAAAGAMLTLFDRRSTRR